MLPSVDRLTSSHRPRVDPGCAPPCIQRQCPSRQPRPCPALAALGHQSPPPLKPAFSARHCKLQNHPALGKSAHDGGLRAHSRWRAEELHWHHDAKYRFQRNDDRFHSEYVGQSRTAPDLPELTLLAASAMTLASIIIPEWITFDQTTVCPIMAANNPGLTKLEHGLSRSLFLRSSQPLLLP